MYLREYSFHYDKTAVFAASSIMYVYFNLQYYLCMYAS